MKTYSAKKGEVARRWFLIDLDGLVLGRAASKIAMILRGKNKPQFTPHIDTGDFVVAVNAKKVALTGQKLEQKKYYRYSGYIGGMRTTTAGKRFEKKPESLLQDAVSGMLPKTILGRHLLKKLKIYAGPDHPHAAQKPEVLKM